jgi:hypothetical protein
LIDGNPHQLEWVECNRGGTQSTAIKEAYDGAESVYVTFVLGSLTSAVLRLCLSGLSETMVDRYSPACACDSMIWLENCVTNAYLGSSCRRNLVNVEVLAEITFGAIAGGGF